MPQIEDRPVGIHPLFRQKGVCLAGVHISDLGVNPGVDLFYFTDDAACGVPSSHVGQISCDQDATGPWGSVDFFNNRRLLVNIAESNPKDILVVLHSSSEERIWE